MITPAQRLLSGLAPPVRVVRRAFAGQALFDDEAPAVISSAAMAAGAVAWLRTKKAKRRRRGEASMLLGKRYRL